MLKSGNFISLSFSSTILPYTEDLLVGQVSSSASSGSSSLTLRLSSSSDLTELYSAYEDSSVTCLSGDIGDVAYFIESLIRISALSYSGVLVSGDFSLLVSKDSCS